MENEFPTPNIWNQNAIINEQVSSQPRQSRCDCPKQTVNWLRDTFCTLYTGGTLLKECAIDSLPSAHSIRKRILCGR